MNEYFDRGVGLRLTAYAVATAVAVGLAAYGVKFACDKISDKTSEVHEEADSISGKSSKLVKTVQDWSVLDNDDGHGDGE